MRPLAGNSTDRVPPPGLEELRARREEILVVAARRGASNIRVFGSVARGEAGADSDLDLIVDGVHSSGIPNAPRAVYRR